MNNVSTSIQRWVYAGASNAPDALRALADEMDRLYQLPIEKFPPEGECWVDDSLDAIVTLTYNEDAPDDLFYRAGICMTFMSVK